MRVNNRIVCAANRCIDIHGNTLIVIGIRHFDVLMHSKIKLCRETNLISNNTRWEQGFVDQYSNFLNRKDAYVIAKANGQIIRECGNPDSIELFSENLY